MKFHPFSDLHIPHHIIGDGKSRKLTLYKNFLDKFMNKLPDVDVYIIAGDFCDTARIGRENYLYELLNHFSASFPNKHIVYIPGNHEFYRTSFDGVFANRINLPENIHWLHRDSIEIEGAVFAGSTLWFPKTVMTNVYKHMLNDYHLIHGYEGFVYHENELDQNFFKSEIAHRDKTLPLICVSHHLPCEDVISHSNHDDPTNIFYVGSYDIHNYLGDKDITWIHGHSHEPYDFKLGETRVLRNPYGYYSDCTMYNEKLVIEV